MGMSTAERQRAYRRRHLRDGADERLSMVVPVQVKRRLERLARHRGVSQRVMLAVALASLEQEILNGMDDTSAFYDSAGGSL
ncbi:hypothetical protein [Nitrococcus mobilis]|uniref:Uncharacterized protein n=1 Tax=Nitrococcus mobilis Nb-231 TaxID=314278 RepID=A4BLU9_9GAMM|nr:hypothetical protein [Nitrococcus mobilis]EAR23287.1 hypothetical protein NB231_15743 [Nitrococcus mobilis Nb-231]